MIFRISSSSRRRSTVTRQAVEPEVRRSSSLKLADQRQAATVSSVRLSWTSRNASPSPLLYLWLLLAATFQKTKLIKIEALNSDRAISVLPLKRREERHFLTITNLCFTTASGR